MSQPRQPQPPAPDPNQDTGRTHKVLLPPEWNPQHWGGWELHVSNPVPDQGVDFDLYVRPGEEDDWGVGITFDAADNRSHLLNPITVTDVNGHPYVFWPDCAEDAQALLSQIGRYGFARPIADGWAVFVTVTAAAARTAIAADSALHLVKHGLFGWEFVDLDGTEAHRLVAEIAGNHQETIDVVYYATWNGGTIDKDSVRVLRVSRASISLAELDTEREETGLGWNVNTATLPISDEIKDSDLVAYATEQIRNTPPFDFLAEVIGDDLVVGGVTYDRDVYALDGEGGVMKKTPTSALEDPDANAGSEATGETSPHPGATGPVAQEEARPQTRVDRPGTPGSRHAGILPPDGQARRR
ncbi:hypothetical protein [Actinophytocola sp.]|uniref:hypothetical protein n=1 Tax=Actinophytocola sp. TaxID=1872138 RepID=UPI003899AC55